MSAPLLRCLGEQELELSRLVAAGRHAGAIVTLDPDFRATERAAQIGQVLERRGQMGEADARKTGKVHGLLSFAEWAPTGYSVAIVRCIGASVKGPSIPQYVGKSVGVECDATAPGIGWKRGRLALALNLRKSGAAQGRESGSQTIERRVGARAAGRKVVVNTNACRLARQFAALSGRPRTLSGGHSKPRLRNLSAYKQWLRSPVADGTALALSGDMLRCSLFFGVLALTAGMAHANDLKQYYELALTRDTTLQAAHFQRDALIEARPQAIAEWLPQVSANASAERERVGYNLGPALGSQAADCTISSTASTQRCYGTAHTLGLNMSQTLWSFQSFSQLKEANFQVAAAEASYQGAQENLLLRVAQAYFGILSAADQLATNVAEREAFNTLLQPGQSRDSRPASGRAATSTRRRRSMMRPSRASSTRAMRSTMRIWLWPRSSANASKRWRRCARTFRCFLRNRRPPTTGSARRDRTTSMCAPRS